MKKKTTLKNKKTIYQTYKELMKEWDWEKNKELELDPRKLTCGSGKKAWWKCNKKHEWKATIYHRTKRKTNCPYCSSTYKKVCIDNCLATKFPEIAKKWHPTKNGKLTPKDVTSRSGRKVWWICEKKHEWKSVIYNRTNKNKTGCPCCARQKVCKENCLETLYPELSREWHSTKNGKITPKNIMPKSNKKAWWKCSKKHEWKSVISNRTTLNRNCPYCCNQKVYKNNCLSTKFPKIAKEWDSIKNKKITPKNVTPGTNKKAWWICSTNKLHKWETTIKSRSRGKGCPYCFKKNEAKVKNILLKHFKNWNIKYNKKIWDRYKKYNHRRYCDFWIEKQNIKIMVEYDGEQHFKPVQFGGMNIEKAQKIFKNTQIKDKLDKEFCKENNIILHRIKYDEDKEKSIKELKIKIDNN